ncbi:MAG TPA: DUF3047 domain-containing protein [Hyphomicrobium sp.]|jgi:hypothetical protein
MGTNGSLGNINLQRRRQDSSKSSEKAVSLAVLVCLLSHFCFLPSAGAAIGRFLIDPATILETADRMDFVGHNAFAIERTPRGIFLRSTPQGSSSGLYTKLDVDGRSLTNVQWTWRVDAMQASADLRTLAKEDSSATIFFIFGEPSFINRDVPTLAYVWSATPVADGTVFNSARFASLRYIQLHGARAIGTWQSETRNVVRDYETAFGTEPGTLRYVAILNDNDQTGEPCSALFGPILDAR